MGSRGAKRAPQPRPVRLASDFGDVIVTSAASDEEVARLRGGGEHLAPHTHRHDEISISMRDPYRHLERADSRDGVEVHARDESEDRSQAGNDHAARHRPRRREWSF